MPDITNLEIWVLAINHEHGTNIYTHLSEEGYKNDLIDYVREWWSDEMSESIDSDIYKNCSDEELIDHYFSSVEDESYSIQNVILQS